MFEILPTDRMFIDSPQPGPDCLCSRCGMPITEGIPIRAVDERSIYEYRYHPDCAGMYAAGIVGGLTVDEIDFEIPEDDDLNDEFSIN